jgi:septal ring factor EnvC (AmiA/AmiB activator)
MASLNPASELEAFALVDCPNCGTEVATAVKSWPVSFRRQGESKASPQFCIGIFECPKCKTKFRSRVELKAKPAKSAETTNVKNAVEKIKDIREGLMQTLKTLREKLRTLETERAGLMAEIEELKKAAESRAEALENEVNQLREEMKSLRELVGSNEEKVT